MAVAADEENSYVEPSYDEADKSEEEESYEPTYYRPLKKKEAPQPQQQPMNDLTSVGVDNLPN